MLAEFRLHGLKTMGEAHPLFLVREAHEAHRSRSSPQEIRGSERRDPLFYRKAGVKRMLEYATAPDWRTYRRSENVRLQGTALAMPLAWAFMGLLAQP